MPPSNAVSEHSFSSLHRLKSYLQSTMTQERLNSILMLHAHNNLNDNWNLTEIGNEFVMGSEHTCRLTPFRKFLETDLMMYSVHLYMYIIDDTCTKSALEYMSNASNSKVIE